jgi:hypothetical protein
MGVINIVGTLKEDHGTGKASPNCRPWFKVPGGWVITAAWSEK